jgi:hypothetical protein
VKRYDVLPLEGYGTEDVLSTSGDYVRFDGDFEMAKAITESCGVRYEGRCV